MNRALVVAVLVAALLTATAVLRSQEPASVAVASVPTVAPCVWDDELQRTLDELGEDPADWRLARSPGYWGKVFPDGTVVVNPDVPCGSVASVVRHEWLHLQQLDRFGPDLGALMLGRDRVEIVADCGSLLLGSTNTPYVQELLDEHGAGCTEADLADARELINHGRAPR